MGKWTIKEASELLQEIGTEEDERFQILLKDERKRNSKFNLQMAKTEEENARRERTISRNV